MKIICTVLIACVFTALLTTSCKHGNQYPKETATLDSLNKVLLSTDSLLRKTDSAKIKKSVDHVIITMDYVHMLAKDTVSSSARDILKTFGSTQWELQIFLNRQAILKKELPKSIAQIDHLSHDMKNDLIKKDSAMIFYDFEVKKAKELIEAANYGLGEVKMQMPILELVAPQADSLINRLKNHQKI